MPVIEVDGSISGQRVCRILDRIFAGRPWPEALILDNLLHPEVKSDRCVFKPDEDGCLEALQPLPQHLIITLAVHHAPPLTASSRWLKQHLMALLRHVDRHEDYSCRGP